MHSAPTRAPLPLPFRLLRVGSCTHREAVAMQGAPWRIIRFPTLVGVIRHPTQGVILYDTGYSGHFRDATKRLPERIYRWMTPVHLPAHEVLTTQLGNLGIAPSDVRRVIISHFHADHIAGLRDFPQARFLCMRADWDSFRRMGRLQGLGKGFLPALLPRDFEERLEFAEDSAEISLPVALASLQQCGPARDILGDGSLTAIPLPGHSCCQMGLLLHASRWDGMSGTSDVPENAQPVSRTEVVLSSKSAETRDVPAWTFLISDAAWSIQALRENRPPHWLADSIVHSRSAYLEVFERLSTMVRTSEPKLLPRLVPSHCSATFNAWSQGDGPAL